MRCTQITMILALEIAINKVTVINFHKSDLSFWSYYSINLLQNSYMKFFLLLFQLNETNVINGNIKTIPFKPNEFILNHTKYISFMPNGIFIRLPSQNTNYSHYNSIYKKKPHIISFLPSQICCQLPWKLNLFVRSLIAILVSLIPSRVIKACDVQ